MIVRPKGLQWRALPIWRWVAFMILLVLFPKVLHPWWLDVISFAVFVALGFALLSVKPKLHKEP